MQYKKLTKGAIMAITGFKVIETGECGSIKEGDVLVIAHNGHFHADDVTAAALIKTFIESENIGFIRVGHQSDIKEVVNEKVKDGFRPENIYVVDVGGIHDGKNFFDHHQYRKEEVPHAAAGLVFKMLKERSLIDNYLESKLKDVIKMVDDHDIGIEMAGPGTLPWIINYMNNEDNPYDDTVQSINFEKAVNLLYDIFTKIKDEAETFNTAVKRLASECYIEKMPDGYSILIMPEYIDKWQEAILSDSKYNEVEAVVWYDKNQDKGKGQVVPKEMGSFERRGIGFPPEVEAEGKQFIHNGEFFCVFDTVENVIAYIRDYAR